MARPFRKNIVEKGKRLFAEGKVKVLDRHERFIKTEVEGTTGVYQQIHFADGTFGCNCASPNVECSHVVASRLAIPKEYRPLTFGERSEAAYGKDDIDFD